MREHCSSHQNFPENSRLFTILDRFIICFSIQFEVSTFLVVRGILRRMNRNGGECRMSEDECSVVTYYLRLTTRLFHRKGQVLLSRQQFLYLDWILNMRPKTNMEQGLYHCASQPIFYL